MKVFEILAAALRLLGKGLLNVIGLIVGFLLLGLAISFVVWLAGKSYSSPQGYLVYSILPLFVIFIGGLLWVSFRDRISDWWREQRRRD